MTEDYREDGDFIDVPDDRTESEREYDRQIVRLDAFFSQLQPGVTMLVQRLRPSWCAGLLEEITVTDEAIDLDYFINTWGGEVLSIKVRDKLGRLNGSYKIPLKTYPPLRFGEPIRPNDRGATFKDLGETSSSSSSTPVIVNPPVASKALETLMTALPAVLPFVLKFFENAEARRQADMALMINMMRSNQGGGIADISKLGVVMSELSKVFEGRNDNPGDMDFIPQALDVLKMVMGKPETPAPAGNRGRLTGSNAGTTSKQTGRLAPPPSPLPAPAPSTSATVTALPNRNLAETLSDMSPDKAAETIIEALGRMPEDKRTRAIGHFMSEFDDTMEDDFGDDGADDNTLRGRS